MNNPDWPEPGPTAGISSVAIGFGVDAGEGAAAVGASANATGEESAAVGRGANAAGDWSAAIGSYANAAGGSSAAVGIGAYAAGYMSAAIGTSAFAAGGSSAAIGNGANAAGDMSAAIGGSAVAENHMQITLGIGHAHTSGAFQHEVHVPGVLVLYSPDHAMWAVTVDNAGQISATPWTPPNISPMG